MKLQSKKQLEYLEEYEKYKHIQIELGTYELKGSASIKYEILEVNELENKIKIKTIRTDNIQTKTVHWCRKNLTKI